MNKPVSDISSEVHYLNSALRERIVEHVFIGDALRRLWQLGITDVEILRSEFDAGGYDLVMSRGRIVRHIQFKTATIGGSATQTTIGLRLIDKPSGCVIWIMVTPSLDLGPFLWFGAPPGEPLSNTKGLKIAKHTRANSQGLKAERPGHRVVPMSRFETVATLDGILERLFGSLEPIVGREHVNEAASRFPSAPSTRNPPWIREELIVALDFYLRHRKRLPSKESGEIRELQRIIAAVAAFKGITGDSSLRNTNGVYMKLMNLRSLDPHFANRGAGGLKQGGKLERELWKEMAGDAAECRRLALAIKNSAKG